MRALSVKNPWAELIASGRKRIELRTWTTSYRGPVIIVSGASPARSPEALRWKEQLAAVRSRAVAVVEISDVRPATAADERHACCAPKGNEFAWCLRLVRRLELERLVKGRLSLFYPDDELIRLVTGQISSLRLR